jgi:hypothetical protein
MASFHGRPLPTYNQLARMTREALKESRQTLDDSLEVRYQEALEKGLETGHNERIVEEQELLGRINSILEKLIDRGIQ